MNYYSVIYSLTENENLVKTETIGIKSEQKLTSDEFDTFVKGMIQTEPGQSLAFADKLDIGEKDYYRIEKKFSC